MSFPSRTLDPRNTWLDNYQLVEDGTEINHYPGASSPQLQFEKNTAVIRQVVVVVVVPFLFGVCAHIAKRKNCFDLLKVVGYKCQNEISSVGHPFGLPPTWDASHK